MHLFLILNFLILSAVYFYFLSYIYVYVYIVPFYSLVFYFLFVLNLFIFFCICIHAQYTLQIKKSNNNNNVNNNIDNNIINFVVEPTNNIIFNIVSRINIKNFLINIFNILQPLQTLIYSVICLVSFKFKYVSYCVFNYKLNKDAHVHSLLFFINDVNKIITINTQFFIYNNLQINVKFNNLISYLILSINSYYDLNVSTQAASTKIAIVPKLFTNSILFTFKKFYNINGYNNNYFKFFEIPLKDILNSNFVFIINFFKTIFISLCVFFIYFLFNLFYFKLNFLKYIAIWFSITILFFWLISSFTFFLKRNRFGKFTCSIQRFWKRANFSFWLIEGFLFIIFFYYYMNSSQEPLYSYDISSLNKEFNFDLIVFYNSSILLIFIIFLLLFLQTQLATLTFRNIFFYLFFIYFFILYLFFIESYQFYYLITTFFTKIWVWDEIANLWILEIETPRVRTKTSYFHICLIAKYWHFLFIFFSWFFIFSKILEQRTVNVTVISINLQNFIFLFFLNLFCYVQWFKWLFRKFYDNVFYWFFSNFQLKFFKIIFFDIISFFI